MDETVIEGGQPVDCGAGLEVAGDDAGAVREGEDAPVGSEIVQKAPQDGVPEVLKVLYIRFSHLSEQ